MSGIAAILRLDGAPVMAATTMSMLGRMARRGPDRSHAWQDGPIGMGQVLLATTPEARNELQPWRHAESGCVIVTDSRLDERAALARQLQLPTQDLDALGDAELIHAAWQRWGSECPTHLLGDFTFAIWDGRRGTLFCARDPLGVRPLYLHHAPGRLFALASEPGALLALPEVPADLDEGRIVDTYIDPLEGIDKTCTFHTAIQRLPPAHSLTLAGDRTTYSQYWQPLSTAPLPADTPENEWVEGLRHHLERAVQRRMRACVPVGSMLSGGLDSSSVVAIAAAVRGADDPLPTFSATSAEPDCPETRAIHAMLGHYALDATCIEVGAAEPLIQAIVDDPGALGEPFDVFMTLVDCQYLSAHRKGVRMMLDGIDGDNLLSHGDQVQRLLAAGHWRQAWHEARAEAAFYGAPFHSRSVWGPWAVRQIPQPLRGRLRQWRAQVHRQAMTRQANLPPGLAGRVDTRARLARLADSIASSHVRSTDGRAATSIGSPFTTVGVERYGRVAAARGIEPRHAFLDRELVDFATWIPPGLLLRDGYPKWALRTAMAGQLPPDVTWRRGKEHLGWRFNLARYRLMAERMGIKPAASTADWEASLMSLARKQLCL